MPNTVFSPSKVDFDRRLIERLDCSGPRYTSYPTADCFNDSFGEAEYRRCLQAHAKLTPGKALSLYVHIPFCNSVCFYCACNKIITKDKSKADVYLDYLELELALITENIGLGERIVQLHLGGGSPTFLSAAQIERLMNMLHKYFSLDSDGEFSIEIDPRKISRENIAQLCRLGFNRMSIGIQDFNPQVQSAISRVQSESETRLVIDAARASGVKSISVDLIYGLPHQTLSSVEQSLERVLSLSPERLAFYNYAHLPEHFLVQRRINNADLPPANIKLDILQNSVQQLINAGYVFIGMDHFAKPDDELAIALENGKLQRNFQGYSTHAECDMIGVGVSSIGRLANIYAQNEKQLEDYYSALDSGRLPIKRGIVLNADDELRRNIIQELMCRFSLSISRIEQGFCIDFAKYFAIEIETIYEYQSLGLLTFDNTYLRVKPKGRFLIRNIAMLFDSHLRSRKNTSKYSKTI